MCLRTKSAVLKGFMHYGYHYQLECEHVLLMLTLV